MSLPDSTRITMSTYTVIPYQQNGGVMRCIYLDSAGTRVPGNQIDCHAQGFKVDFLCLRGLQGDMPEAVRQDVDVVENLVLFAAVAKTLEGGAGLQNMVLADEHQCLVLPVMPGTKRGVILVFKRVSEDGTTGLIATSDPEIKNTGSGQRVMA